MNEWSAAAEILDRARDLIEEHGWQQGATDAVQSHCLATALEASLRHTGHSMVDFNYAREALSQRLGIARNPSDGPQGGSEVPYWGGPLMEWNDTPGRSKREVVKELQAAAELARRLSLGRAS